MSVDIRINLVKIGSEKGKDKKASYRDTWKTEPN